ncbi:GDSL-type esterase/lipase family protein [Micromonospora endolithica]|uniref:SGNH/GDSL hydrolase family protein n=1 Tax=Micromonospora endolithica TaxID=230091 RepID=A0A3A9YTF3_9ACTN|nr:GDSL-type esterase/lipase family protein [Micromonospora endolithica]RKN39321.1 SGNH/GDSL hydrolase family protein [Micromonospora endolithica]TWJ22758.1 lysophospholipase L1-like esterase [Micromonospora endolithica]
MPRRWVAAVACLLALVALACERGGEASPRPTRSAAPGTAGGIAALGDSISTGFGSCLVLTSCQRNSWSTGDGSRVDSVYRRLLDDNAALRGKAHNHARPGARASALAGQAEAAVRDRVDLATVLIGANDVCRGGVEVMTPVADFRKDVDRGLRVLRTGRPKARVLVVSIPDLHRLWEVGHTNERAVRVWRRGICPALLANPTSDDPLDRARRATVRERITAYNAQLAAACRAYGSRCRYDGGAAHKVRFTPELINQLDWFHPNAAGQDKLAAVAWRAWGISG